MQLHSKKVKLSLLLGLIAITLLVSKAPVSSKGKLLAAWINSYDSLIQARAELRLRIQKQSSDIDNRTAELWRKKSQLAELQSSLVTIDALIQKLERIRAQKGVKM